MTSEEGIRWNIRNGRGVWVYWTDDLTAQEFMDYSRAQGHPIIGAAVDRMSLRSQGWIVRGRG